MKYGVLNGTRCSCVELLSDSTVGVAGEEVMPDAPAIGDGETAMPAAIASVDDESDDEADREVRL